MLEPLRPRLLLAFRNGLVPVCSLPPQVSVEDARADDEGQEEAAGVEQAHEPAEDSYLGVGLFGWRRCVHPEGEVVLVGVPEDSEWLVLLVVDVGLVDDLHGLLASAALG